VVVGGAGKNVKKGKGGWGEGGGGGEGEGWGGGMSKGRMMGGEGVWKSCGGG